ncbi:MAG TPA: exosortase/archaeosortase family protein [Thiolapillus brandeum]|uniref:Exosortase/archaeosortase family protein n=1 Tax=Thiolapillus brandeum TaxID=1076588 RepID=A0A7C5IZ56_9GAMM|nr:exosortase/archaeosortase family protein [Thiolapillus brandeum]
MEVAEKGAAALLSGGRERRFLPWLLGGLYLAVYGPTLAWLWHRWTLSIWYNGHGILITLVVAWLVREELRRFEGRPRDANPWGFLLLVPALALHMLDTGIHSQLLSAFSLVLGLPGLSLLLLGTERTRAIIFPLLVLFLTLPIPLVFTESIHLFLRHIATVASAWILPHVGIPVFASGTLLETPNGSLMVADACSGFSTLYATVTVAVLTAYATRSRWRRVAVLLVAVPLAIVVNVARVVVLAVLVDRFGLDVLHTSAHELSGMATFAVALPLIFWLGYEPRKQEAGS